MYLVYYNYSNAGPESQATNIHDTYFSMNMRSTCNILHYHRISSIPQDKISDLTKLKALTDDTISVTIVTILAFDEMEKIVGKRRKCCNQHLLLFLQCFEKASP